MEIEMFYMILCAGMFIGLIVGVVMAVGGSDALSVVFLALAFACLILFIISGCSVGNADYERAEDPYVTHEIMCLNDNSMMTGRFYLRSGYIDENLHYLYGYKTVYGGMKTQKVNAKIATVYFDDSVEPCAKWYKETQRWWFLTDTSYSCDIYVPTDSLDVGYTIDLQ